MPFDTDHATPRADLGAALMQYPLTQPGFVGLQLLPVLPAGKQAATFKAVKADAILRDRDTKVNAGGAAPRDDYAVVDVSYACEKHAFETQITPEDRQFYSNDFDAEMMASEFCRDVILRAQERRIAALLQDVSATGWYASDASLYTDVSTDWDNVASTIVADVLAARQKIVLKCGLQPDTLVLSAAHLPNLLNNTDIKARISNVQMLTEQNLLAALAPLMGLRRVLLAGGVRNSGGEGDTESNAFIWSDDYAWLGVTAMNGGLAAPGVGRTILWQPVTGQNTVVEQYAEPQTDSDVIRCKQWVDEKIVDVRFGHVLKIDT